MAAFINLRFRNSETSILIEYDERIVADANGRAIKEGVDLWTELYRLMLMLRKDFPEQHRITPKERLLDEIGHVAHLFLVKVAEGEIPLDFQLSTEGHAVTPKLLKQLERYGSSDDSGDMHLFMSFGDLDATELFERLPDEKPLRFINTLGRYDNGALKADFSKRLRILAALEDAADKFIMKEVRRRSLAATATLPDTAKQKKS